MTPHFPACHEASLAEIVSQRAAAQAALGHELNPPCSAQLLTHLGWVIVRRRVGW